MTRSRSIVVGAALWSIAGEVAARLVPPAVVAWLVRVLAADDFGVVAAAMIVVGFCQLFWDAGFAKALVQTDAPEASAANVAFWSTLILALVAYTVVVALAAPLGRVFGDPRIAGVLPILGLQIVLSGVASTFTALLQRRLEFRLIFAARIANAIVSAAVSLTMATSGFGFRALVGGLLAGSAAQLAVLAVTARWRPSIAFDRAVANRLWAFSRWSMTTALLSWFFVFADQLIVGSWFGTTALGQYGTVSQLVSLTIGLCVAPLMPVLYAFLSQMRDRDADMRDALMRVHRAIAFMIAPLVAIAIALATPLRTVLFGPGWDPVVELLPPIAIGAGLSWLAVANNEAYRAGGRPQLETRIMSICLVIYLAGYLVGAQLGLHAFAWIRALLAGLGLAVHLAFAAHFLRLPVGAYVRAVTPAAVAGTLTATVGWFAVRAGWVDPGAVPGLAAAAVGLGLVYFALLPVVARDFLWAELPALLSPRGSGRS